MYSNHANSCKMIEILQNKNLTNVPKISQRALIMLTERLIVLGYVLANDMLKHDY